MLSEEELCETQAVLFLPFSLGFAYVSVFALPTKVRLVKAMVFLVDMYGCESWKAEHPRIDTFKLWC